MMIPFPFPLGLGRCLGPVFESLAASSEYASKGIFAKVDISDSATQLNTLLGVPQVVPTFKVSSVVHA